MVLFGTNMHNTEAEKRKRKSVIGICSKFDLFPREIILIFHYSLGVKVRNMKMDFNTRGTWRRVGKEH